MKKDIANVVLAVASGALAGTIWAGALDHAYLKGVTDRCPPYYGPGEEMTFTIRLEGAERLPGDMYYVSWKRTGDDEQEMSGKSPLCPGRPLVVRTSLDRPGFVRVAARVEDKNGNVFEKPGIVGGWEERQVFFDGSAGVQPERIVTGVPEPTDFDEFWMAHRAELAKVPMQAELREVESPDGCSRRYQVSISCAGDRPATGYLLVPSKQGKYPACIDLCGYGDSNGGRCCIAGDPTSLVFCLNAHGYELGREAGYYQAFMKSIESNGQSYAFDPVQNASSKTCYFSGMTWRLMRALDYLKSRPEWDGKNLVARGGSQGGLQAIWAAALDSDVTSAHVGFPWCCDMSGKDVLKRNSDNWRIRWAAGLGYYDPVHLAKRIPKTCKVDIYRAGLGDYCCPPSGVAALWNALRCPKEIRWVQGSTHNWEPPKPNQEYTLRD